MAQFSVMFSVANINDPESLQWWLDDQSRVASVWVASRSGARALPFFWHMSFEDKEKHRGKTALQILRNLLTLMVYARIPAAKTREVILGFDTRDAYQRPNGGHFYQNIPTIESMNQVSEAAANDAGNVVGYALGTAYRENFAELAASAANLSTGSTGMWADILRDCETIAKGSNPEQTPLWAAGDNSVIEIWEKTRDGAKKDINDWSFWIRWYESLLDGNPLPNSLLEQVALIDTEIWEAGPAVVAEKIADIQLERAILATSNAERIEINPETGKFCAVFESDLSEDHLVDALDKMQNAVAIFEDVDVGNNTYGVLLPERDLIADTIVRYPNRPMRLYDNCNRAARRVRDKVASGDCVEGDALVNDFVHELTEVAADLKSSDSKVREVTSLRQIENMKELPEEAHDLFVAVSNELAADSEGELAEQLQQNAFEAIDPNLSASERKEALNRQTGRLLRAFTIVRAGLASSASLVKDATVVLGGAGTIGGAVYFWVSGKMPSLLPWLLSLF